jgi:hypothetical protein
MTAEMNELLAWLNKQRSNINYLVSVETNLLRLTALNASAEAYSLTIAKITQMQQVADVVK